MEKILRLTYPQWQGGHREIFSLGSKILNFIAPETEEHISETIPIIGSEKEESKEDIKYQNALIEQTTNSKNIILKHKPNKLIVFGGDCLVAQSPLDYLNGIYDDLGVIWFDAHPDISTPEQTDEAHAMVLGNLLHKGNNKLSDMVENPFDSSQFLYVGLVEEKMSTYEKKAVEDNKVNYINAEDKNNVQKVNKWVEENKIGHLAIFLDLDVLSPKEFRSIMPAEPYLENFAPAIGNMTFQQISDIINAVNVEQVSIIITEYMPWDAMNLSKFMDNIEIFK